MVARKGIQKQSRRSNKVFCGDWAAFGLKRQNSQGACPDDPENVEIQMLTKPGNSPLGLGEKRELAKEATVSAAEFVAGFDRLRAGNSLTKIRKRRDCFCGIRLAGSHETLATG
jgi:hypothetical protein